MVSDNDYDLNKAEVIYSENLNDYLDPLPEAYRGEPVNMNEPIPPIDPICAPPLGKGGLFWRIQNGLRGLTYRYRVRKWYK